MAGICLFTDSSAILPDVQPTDNVLIQTIPLINCNQESLTLTKCNTADGPFNLICIPTVEWLVNQFQTILHNNYGILGIFHSSKLSECYHTALKAAGACKGGREIIIIDSHTLGPGLGILVSIASKLIWNNFSLPDIDRNIRGMISRVYTVISTTQAHNLYKNGYVTYAQAVINDMLGLIPIFSLEQSGLYPLDKVRSVKQILEFYQSFISEFDNPQQIALMLSAKPSMGEEQNILTDFIRQNYPGIGFSISTINETNTAFFGTHTTGLFLIDGYK